MTKQVLFNEMNMDLEAGIEAEAQARCMETADFERAYQAFVKKQTPEFEGN